MLWPVVKALLGHYRRYPLQIFLVWLGLTLGVSLLVGVTAINHHARQSYEHGEKLFSNPLPYRIRSKHIANKIPQGFYIQLRRDGFQQCVPFDDYRFSTTSGLDIILQGVDPVALLSLDSSKTLGATNRIAINESTISDHGESRVSQITRLARRGLHCADRWHETRPNHYRYA